MHHKTALPLLLPLFVFVVGTGCSCDGRMASTDTDGGRDATDTQTFDGSLSDSGVADIAVADVAVADVAIADTNAIDTNASDASSDSSDCEGTAGFCWVFPPGNAVDWNAVDGTRADDLWAVGAGGKLGHRTARGWQLLASPVAHDLYDIAVRSADDIWVVGDAGTLLHFDGNVWSSVAFPSPENLKVVDATATSVWVGGAAVWRRTGTSWTSFTRAQSSNNPYGEISAMRTFADDDVWVGNEFGDVQRWNGSMWSFTDADFSSGNFGWYRVVSLWGTSASDVWAVSREGKAQHFDGTRWTQLPFDPPVGPSYAQAGASYGAGRAWLASPWGLIHFDGPTHTNLAYAEGLRRPDPRGVWSNAELTVVVGLQGQIFERTGSTITQVSGVRGYETGGFGDAVVVDRARALFCGPNLVRYQDEALSNVSLPTSDRGAEFGTCWGTGLGNAWMVGIGSSNNNIVRYDGVTTAFPALPGPIAASDHTWLMDVWGSSANDVYMVGLATTLHFDGTTFTSINKIAQSVHGTSANDVWIAADRGISHFDGSTWTAFDARGVWWTEVHATSSTDVWFGGEGSRVMHYNGSRWTETPLPFPTTGAGLFISGFGGRSSNDVWATAGDHVFHWNGASWSLVTRVGTNLSGVQVGGDGSVFLIGGNAILRRG